MMAQPLRTISHEMAKKVEQSLGLPGYLHYLAEIGAIRMEGQNGSN